MSTMAGSLRPPAGMASNAGRPPAQRMLLVTISGTEIGRSLRRRGGFRDQLLHWVILWLAGLEWQFLARGNALLPHRQDHRDRNVGSGHCSQINELLLTEDLLGAMEGLVRDHMPGR